jgi:tetratricopeptide (TPR) repeat protein
MYDQAIDDYTKAIEADPGHAQVYNNRGIACRFRKQYDKAISDYTKAMN